MTATTKLARWGNSLALRLPKAVAEDARLREGHPVTVRVAGKGSVVIEPARRRFKLKELVSRINRKNRHQEVVWGRPLGKEMW